MLKGMNLFTIREVIEMDYLFNDYVELYSEIDKREWITVFEENETKNYDNDIFTFCAMFKGSDEELRNYTSRCDWGFSTESFGKSTFIQYGNDEVEYLSSEEKGKFEYLIAIRYYDKYPSTYDINPKLVWYGNLRYAEGKYSHPKTDEIMIRANKHKVEIRTSYLKDFLSANNCYLTIVFDHHRYFKEDILKNKKDFDIYLGENYYMTYSMNKVQPYSDLKKMYDYCSSVIGKTIILPYGKPQHEDYKFFLNKISLNHL